MFYSRCRCLNSQLLVFRRVSKKVPENNFRLCLRRPNYDVLQRSILVRQCALSKSHKQFNPRRFFFLFAFAIDFVLNFGRAFYKFEKCSKSIIGYCIPEFWLLSLPPSPNNFGRRIFEQNLIFTTERIACVQENFENFLENMQYFQLFFKNTPPSNGGAVDKIAVSNGKIFFYAPLTPAPSPEKKKKHQKRDKNKYKGFTVVLNPKKTSKEKKTMLFILVFVGKNFKTFIRTKLFCSYKMF